MFFKQVRRNAARNRRGNGLFFGSLIIAVVAFYTLLSLGEQDVMKFLSTIESDAVRKLMRLVPFVYVVSLFFVFFLVYFACKYQMDARRREFGMYLMLGMKRSRLFFMLFCETLWSSLISLLIGLPAAVFLTEGISLVTAKFVGLGILSHTVSFSADAVLWTVCGFVVVQLFSMLIICIPYGKTEPAKFLRTDVSKTQVQTSSAKSTGFFALGIILLLFSYWIGFFKLAGSEYPMLAVFVTAMLLCCALGTFSLYRGLGGFLGKRIEKKSGNATGLSTFTKRQVQESALSQHKSLAVSSLLLLVALSGISYGIAVGAGTSESRTTDFSVLGTQAEVSAAIASPEVSGMVETSYPVYLSMANTEFDVSDVVNTLNRIDGAENAAENFHLDYILSLSSYNQLMAAMGKEAVQLDDGSAALYSNMGVRGGKLYSIFEKALQKGVTVGIGGKKYCLTDSLYSDNIVADRSITLYTALIVPDGLFQQLARDTEPFCVNLHLKKSVTDELGLMQAIQKMDGYLDKTGLEYDSYLGGIGRNLFYTVAASYLTIYLGILFLLISNTVIGLKYLIQQRANKHRYITLLMLGADAEELCRSAKKQIGTFFALVLSVAGCSSAVTIFLLFSNLTVLPTGAALTTVAALSMIALLAFLAAEIIYVSVVKKAACREIRALDITDRG